MCGMSLLLDKSKTASRLATMRKRLVQVLGCILDRVCQLEFVARRR